MTREAARRALEDAAPVALAALLEIAEHGRRARDRERARAALVSLLSRSLADERTPAGRTTPAGVPVSAQRR